MQDKTSGRDASRPVFPRGRRERADGLLEIATDCGFYVEGTRREPPVARPAPSRSSFPIWRAIERGFILGAADVLASFTLYSIAMSPHLLHEIGDPTHPRRPTRPEASDAIAPLQPDIEDLLLAEVHHHPFLKHSAPRGHEASLRSAARSARAAADQSINLLAAAGRTLRVPALAALMVLAPASSPRAEGKAAIAASRATGCSIVIDVFASARAALAQHALPPRERGSCHVDSLEA